MVLAQPNHVRQAAAKDLKVAPAVGVTAKAISDAITRACDRAHLSALPVLVSAHVSITTQSATIFRLSHNTLSADKPLSGRWHNVQRYCSTAIPRTTL